MQFRNQAIILLAVLSSTTAFVATPLRTSFGLNTRSALFSEADASPAAEVAAAPAAAAAAEPAAEERFTIYVSNVPFGKNYIYLIVWLLSRSFFVST
jgi:hypothetical protein